MQKNSGNTSFGEYDVNGPIIASIQYPQWKSEWPNHHSPVG